MADNDRALDPVDALKNERAGSTYEFPTSASMASGEHNEPSAKHDDHSFREASQSWDASGNGSSSSRFTREREKQVSRRAGRNQSKYLVAADTTDDFVHESPWRAITMAALTGVIMGMLVSR